MKEDSIETIIQSIISMAPTINMVVVVEGVETYEQLHFLDKQGCDVIQGFLFSKPLSSCSACSMLIEEAPFQSIFDTYCDFKNEQSTLTRPPSKNESNLSPTARTALKR